MMDVDGRRRAVEAAYRAHADDVYRVAYAILRDRELAADVSHDAFARAFERWDRYDPSLPLRAWLHSIVAHMALDAIRRRRVRQLATASLGHLVEIELPGGASGRSGGDPAGFVDLRVQLDAGLAALKPAARAAIVLRHYYGYDYEQIAALLETSVGNVGSMLSRAHATLRSGLAEVQPEAGTASDRARAGRAARPVGEA